MRDIHKEMDVRLMGFRCIFLSQFATAAILKSTDRDKIKLKVT
jgi:hypothetical protein